MTERLEIEQSTFSNLFITSPTSQFILQPFHSFTYVTAHSPTLCCFTYITAPSTTLPLLLLHHNSFSNPSTASPMSQLILQPFHCFTCITGTLLMSPSELPRITLAIVIIKNHSLQAPITSEVDTP